MKILQVKKKILFLLLVLSMALTGCTTDLSKPDNSLTEEGEMVDEEIVNEDIDLEEGEEDVSLDKVEEEIEEMEEIDLEGELEEIEVMSNE
jgi:hypothetical protein